MARVRAPFGGSSGGAQVYDTYINNGKPASGTIDCGFAPKYVLITSQYNGYYWRIYWSIEDPTKVKSAYQTSVTTTDLSSSALTIDATGITISTAIFNGLNSTLFGVLIVG